MSSNAPAFQAVVVYFLSEVYALRSKATDYFEALLNGMRPRAILLYVDNNDSRFTNWFDQMVAAAGLQVLVASSANELLPMHEEKRDLQPYYDKFGDPKLRSNIAYRIVQKPTE